MSRIKKPHRRNDRTVKSGNRAAASTSGSSSQKAALGAFSVTKSSRATPTYAMGNAPMIRRKMNHREMLPQIARWCNQVQYWMAWSEEIEKFDGQVRFVVEESAQLVSVQSLYCR